MVLLNIYQVDKSDYDAYFHRLPLNEIVKTTPEKGTTIYIDITDNNKEICGYHTEEIMGMPANDYYIFNFIDEERLSEPKTYEYITLTEKEYAEFLDKLMEMKGK